MGSSIRFGKTDSRKVEAAAQQGEAKIPTLVDKPNFGAKRRSIWLLPILSGLSFFVGIFLLRGWISPAVDEDARAVDGTAATIERSVAETRTAFPIALTEIAANQNPYADVKVGDIIEFGRYEQNNDLSNGDEPIDWLVLDVSGGNALLVSRYGLDAKRYHDFKEEVT